MGLLVLMVGLWPIGPFFEGLKVNKPSKDIWALLGLVNFYAGLGPDLCRIMAHYLFPLVSCPGNNRKMRVIWWSRSK